MIETIKKPIESLPKKLQVYIEFILQVRECHELEFDTYNKAFYHFEKLINKYMRDSFSKDYEYYIDDINKDYIVINLEYIL